MNKLGDVERTARGFQIIRFLATSRAEWGPGPWDHEPDHVELEGGYLLRHPEMGHWCGYAEIPRGHPWHRGRDKGEGPAHEGLLGRLRPPFYARCAVRPACRVSYCAHSPESLLTVHGGITYSGDILADGRFWLGFDCNHAWDIAPGFRFTKIRFTKFPGSAYRNVTWVGQQTLQLVAQVAAVRPGDHLRMRAKRMARRIERVWLTDPQ